MGIKLLQKTEDFLKKNKKESYSKKALRNELHINYNTILNILAYLYTERKIKIIENEGKIVKYKWRGK